MKEAEGIMSKNDWIAVIIITALIGFAKVVKACETKTIYLPDGSMQVCQICNDVVVCY